MKQIIALLSTAILACNTHAAIITINVEGTLGSWFTKSQIPSTTDIIFEHFLTANPDIAVQGSISYDDTSYDMDLESYTVMTALSLTQIGSVVASTVDTDTITISGLSWNLNGSIIDQLSGSANCTNAFSRCSEMAAAISSNGSNSPFQFDGISAGFFIGQAEQGSGDAYTFDTYNMPTIYMVVESDQVSPSGQAVNASNNALFELTAVPEVPVPAAAWLMGSGLIGLTAVARRRRV